MILRFINGGDDGIFNFLIEGVGAMAGEGSSRKNSLSRGALVLIEVMASVMYLFKCEDMYPILRSRFLCEKGKDAADPGKRDGRGKPSHSTSVFAFS